MQFSHFTNEPLISVRSIEQKPRYEAWSEYDKPRGLWLSVDGEDDWSHWCESESFGIGSLRFRVGVDMARVLLLPSPIDLLDFTEKYGVDTGRSYGRKAIDWGAVAKLHAGIVIAPYHWSRRLDERTNWYYGWDCASGCIWDSGAITFIREFERAPVTESGKQ